MSRGRAIVLAVFTAWPIIHMVLFMGFTFFEVFLGFFSGSPPNDDTFRLVAIITPLHFLTMTITFVLMVIYVVYLFRTDRVAKESKALWAVVLILGNIWKE